MVVYNDVHALEDEDGATVYGYVSPDGEVGLCWDSHLGKFEQLLLRIDPAEFKRWAEAVINDAER